MIYSHRVSWFTRSHPSINFLLCSCDKTEDHFEKDPPNLDEQGKLLKPYPDLEGEA